MKPGKGRHRPRHTTLTNRRTIALIVFAAVAALVAWRSLTLGAAASVYGIAVFSILAAKLGLSLLPDRRTGKAMPGLRVGVVVTVYNEDPELLRACLTSLLKQSHIPESIVVVDDCSTDEHGYPDYRAYDVAAVMGMEHPQIRTIRHDQRLHKRQALNTGFRTLAAVGDVDVFLCVDSDSTLERGAVAAGAAPFADDTVMAATGVVVPSNHDVNTLTRLQDVRYVNAFVTERSAYSALGSVLCVCGAIAFYRADMVWRNLEAFMSQTFLGESAVVGDDRHMTNRALTEGRVVLARDAVSHTAVPEKLSHYTRQQARWGRSFFRESLWALRHLSPRRPGWWLTLVEVAQWAIFSTVLVYVLAVHPLVTGRFIIADYLVFVGAMAMARSVRYFDLNRGGQTWRSKLFTFAVSPLYGYMALMVLMPLRFWSLFTLKVASWGTRDRVEVTAPQSKQEMERTV